MDNDKYFELAGTCEGYYAQYGINVNIQRAIPLIQDGLVPRTRRILYTLYKASGFDKHTKVAVAIGDLLKLHPHGDQGVNETYAHMCQEFYNTVPLLKGHGNTGTPAAGDDYAAPRYYAVSISPLHEKCYSKNLMVE